MIKIMKVNVTKTMWQPQTYLRVKDKMWVRVRFRIVSGGPGFNVALDTISGLESCSSKKKKNRF